MRSRANRMDIPWDKLPYGQVSDAEIARAWDCSTTAVRRQRKARRISAWRGTPNTQNIKIPWDQLVAVLGVLSDSEVARAAMVHLSTVSAVRRCRALPAQREGDIEEARAQLKAVLAQWAASSRPDVDALRDQDPEARHRLQEALTDGRARVRLLTDTLRRQGDGQ